MTKVVVIILQGSAVTETVQGSLVIYPHVAYLLQSVKNYESQLIDLESYKRRQNGPFAM